MALAAPDVFSMTSISPTDTALPPSGTEPVGFEGAISNMTLADVVQIEGQNLFSGSIQVVYQEREGQIFFHRGEVVHAEVGSLGGEEAFNRIMAWPGGSFRLHPNVMTLHQSIHKHREHLLLSAHQWLDESRHGLTELRTGSAPGQPTTVRPEEFMQTVGGVPGVAYAVFTDEDGAPRGVTDARGEDLAAKGAYLATMIAAPLGEAFGLGDLQAALIHAGPERVLLFRSKGTGLSVCLTDDAAPEAVEAGIRQALVARRVSS
ncbi:DUF4388 domain-containing protein [Geothrix edaphica]|uniref:PATAN domain GTPase-activating protein n=1 Tax=Geothrix edaphica TaxID=2927976 RepID=A0ABQ5PWL9_9BACT|nr:DUF4388 domain-containing protein [Geothrix edaphica]GLH66768.1 PATAN domain GTPase-activating protein [Geothrix edaphica]